MSVAGSGVTVARLHRLDPHLAHHFFVAVGGGPARQSGRRGMVARRERRVGRGVGVTFPRHLTFLILFIKTSTYVLAVSVVSLDLTLSGFIGRGVVLGKLVQRRLLYLKWFVWLN